MGAKEDAIQTLENSAEDFAEAIWGRDVRQGLVDVANALKGVVEGYATVVTDDLTDDDPNAAAQAAAVKNEIEKTLQNKGTLASGSFNDVESINGLWTLSINNTYTDGPAQFDGIGIVGVLMQIKYLTSNAIMQIIVRRGGYIYTRMGTPSEWGDWLNGNDELLVDAERHIVEYVPDLYEAPPTDGEFTITQGVYIPSFGGANVTNSEYNIATFDATADKIYEVAILSGASYKYIRAIELVQDGAVKQYYLPEENAKLKRYIIGFSGTVRCSYRNVADGFAVSVRNAIPFGYTVKTGDFETLYSNEYVTANGQRVHTSYNTLVTAPLELNAGDYIKFNASAGQYMAVISETDVYNAYYNPITLGEGATPSLKEYSFFASKHMFIAVSCYNSPPSYTVTQKNDAIVKVPLTWWRSIGITKYGSQATVSDDLKLSYPIAVKRNDVLTYYGYFANNYAAIVKSNRLLSTYQGVQSYPVLEMAPAAGVHTIVHKVTEDGYICVFSKVTNTPSGFSPSLTITRKHDSQINADSIQAIDATKYGELKHNYVDNLDFVPNLAKKRTNAILTYEADDKKNVEHIANAVAYPNGDIIACRAGGKVVKITKDGTETTLLQIANAQDWRGVFMDSNLNVYVSPHSSTFSPGVAVSDRGLYRLPFGSDTFTKVISLYENNTIPQWSSGANYAKGDVVYYLGYFYICLIAHTADSAFDNGYWESPPEWASEENYSAGDMVKYNNCYFVSKTDHVAGERFNVALWMPATTCMTNDDTIWTMCEDKDGYLYAGVYAHSVRKNPAIYRSTDNGLTWFYQHNFITNGTLPMDKYANQPAHVHCVNYNEFDGCLYAAVGEVNTICKSSNKGATWVNLEISCYYGQPTYLLGVKNGLLIGSDGHYSCGVSKLMTDGKTIKNCGRTAPGFIFNIRRSDLTGWLYAFTRVDNFVSNPANCPPIEAVTDVAELEAWKSEANPLYLKWWTDYNEWAQKYYPADAIRPTHAVIMVSKDEGDTWEVIRYEDVCSNYASICGYITVGYFRDGECVVGRLKSVDNTHDGKEFVKPIVISEGKKKRTANGYQLDGEIFIVTNNSTVVTY